MPIGCDRDRRRFLARSAFAIAAAQCAGVISCAEAQSRMAQPANALAGTAGNSGANMSFDSIKQIDAGVLNIAYAEAGPADGKAVILLHGWPYDIYSFVEVTPMLAAKGYRVIVPYVRGYGATRFLSSDTMRNGQPSAVALDTTALMDAMKIQKATL